MKRMKTLGLLLVAVFAISAVAAASASALNVEPANTAFTAESTNAVFTAPNGLTVECSITKGKGTTPKTLGETEGGVKNTFEKCTAFGFPATAVESCETGGESKLKAETTTKVSLLLGEKCKVTVEASGCKLVASGKQTLSGAWANGVQGTSLSTWTLSKAAVTVVTSPETGICGKSGTGSQSGKFSVFQTANPKNTIILK